MKTKRRKKGKRRDGPKGQAEKFLDREWVKVMDALRDLLAYFDRKDDHGWTVADIQRLEEIRAIACPERSERVGPVSQPIE